MSQSRNDNLFTNEAQAKLYAKFRPKYSDQVFEKILAYCKEKPSGFKLAIDVGCGSGQSSVPLTKQFEKVIGIDVSEQQIANAPKDISNLTCFVSRAEELSFAGDSSVDLVTVAQAFHWVDQEKFYKEVNRVLKPNGCLVLYGYGVCQLSHPNSNEYFNHVYNDILPPYWAGGRKMVEEKYRSVELPYPGWKRDDSLSLQTDCTVDDFVGYMGSWSAVQSLLKEANKNFLEDVRKNLHSCLSSKDKADKEEHHLQVIWPVFMLMGRKP